ncbi:phage portal protein [Simplicispira psychrophila]|uniref:phage portal protein n=1 Tax=Simplicispira psychrophila TaxID=80882 RepID=UPI0004876443|nr:phage portal protein [Simplicispira psychrophila]
MSIITRALSAIGLERRSAPIGVGGWPSLTAAGHVTPESAQSIAAVYAAVALIAESIGSLPLRLYQRGDNGDRTIAAGHPLASVLHRTPNDQQCATEFWEWMVSSMLLTGNAYARVTRDNAGQVASLWPLVTDRVQVLRRGEAIGGYDYTDRDGRRERLLPAEVFHLRHRAGTDPLIGVSPIQAARAVIELAQAEAQHGQSTWDNGTRASGILNFAGKLRPEQRTAIAASWQTQHAGGSNAGKVPILEEGTQYTPISMSLADSDYIASRIHTVQEVARIFKVPPIMIGDLSNANYSVSESMNRWFAVHTLGRHLSAIEGAINRQLLTPAAARTLYSEFSLEGLLRGDTTTRAAFYSSGIASGWMLPSEARAFENLDAIPGLDDMVSTTTAVPAAQPYPSKQ